MVKKTHIALFILFQIIFGMAIYAIPFQENPAKKGKGNTSKVFSKDKLKALKIPEIDTPKVAGVPITYAAGGVLSKDSIKSFIKDFKSLLLKHKFKKPSLKSQIFSLKDTIHARIDSMKALKLKLEAFKANEKLLGEVIKRLSPSLNGPLIEWSLHSIEESKHLHCSHVPFLGCA